MRKSIILLILIIGTFKGFSANDTIISEKIILIQLHNQDSIGKQNSKKIDSLERKLITTDNEVV